MFLIFYRHNTPSGDFEEPKFLVSIEIIDVTMMMSVVV